MKIITEKREVLGTLKTLVGTFPLLDDNASKFDDRWRFKVIDEEGFETWIQVHGDFVTIPASILLPVDVKLVKTDEEVQNNPEYLKQLQEVE